MKKVKLFEEFLVESVSLIYESSIGDIHIMAQEADSFTAFRKEFMDEYGKPKSVKELKQLEAWLQTIWNENQTNEGTYNNNKEIAIYDGEDGLTYIEKRGEGYYGYNDEFDFEASNRAELEKKLKSWKYKLISGSIDEALSMDAVYIHQITGSGQDSAQNFIDDNNIDSAKLVAFLKRHKDSKEKYDVRDMINGTNKNKRFMKQFLNEAMQAKDYFKDPMHLADAKGWVRNLKLSDEEIKTKIKAVMKNPAKFNDLMDAMTDELNLRWK